jgi:hypothetical protein
LLAIHGAIFDGFYRLFLRQNFVAILTVASNWYAFSNVQNGFWNHLPFERCMIFFRRYLCIGYSDGLLSLHSVARESTVFIFSKTD